MSFRYLSDIFARHLLSHITTTYSTYANYLGKKFTKTLRLLLCLLSLLANYALLIFYQSQDWQIHRSWVRYCDEEKNKLWKIKERALSWPNMAQRQHIKFLHQNFYCCEVVVVVADMHMMMFLFGWMKSEVSQIHKCVWFIWETPKMDWWLCKSCFP